MVNPTATENITAIKEARKLFNDVRSNLSDNEKKVIRRKLYKKEAASHFFKYRESDNTLTDRQRNVLRNIARYSKNTSKHLKNLSKHQKKSEKYDFNISHLFSKKKDNNKFQKPKMLLNEHKTNLSLEKIAEIRMNFYRKEFVYNALKKKDKLSYEENNILKLIEKYL